MNNTCIFDAGHNYDTVGDRDRKCCSSSRPTRPPKLNSTTESRPGVGSSIQKCSNEQRIAYTQEMCLNLEADAQSLGQRQKAYRHIVVDDKHKILLCVPYKSGATTHLQLLALNSDAALNMSKWKFQRAIRSLYLKGNRAAVGINDFPTYSKQRQQEMLDEYVKVTVTRHPLVRLLSVFHNKVATFNPQTDRWDCKLQALASKRLNKWLSNTQPNATRNCSFGVFVEYLSQARRNFVIDEHLTPMHEWCRPCDIKYDFMVRLESGDTDQRYLIQNYINPSFNGTLHGNAELHSNQVSADKFEDVWPLYSDITDRQLAFLSEVYEYDLKLYGYNYKRTDGGGLSTSCRVSTDTGSSCC